MVIILLGGLSFFLLVLGSFYWYFSKNKVLFFFLMLEEGVKSKIISICKTLIFSLFYSENQIQKRTILCFRKLGKSKVIGKDGAGNIFICFTFSKKETCIFLIPQRDHWRMIQGGAKLPKAFMKSFNLGWYGKVEDLEKAVQRGPVGNFLQNL